jgi:hypothetical protein
MGRVRLRAILPAYVFWKLWRRDRARLHRRDDEEQAASDLALAEITTASARSTLDIELGAADTIDIKAVGLATADVAALTIVVTVHEQVPVWWGPAGLLSFAGVCFFFVLRQRYWEYAPDPERFREDHYGGTRTEILDAMLADLVKYRKHNDPLLKFKARWFQWGYWALAGGLAFLLVATLIHIL